MASVVEPRSAVAQPRRTAFAQVRSCAIGLVRGAVSVQPLVEGAHTAIFVTACVRDRTGIEGT